MAETIATVGAVASIIQLIDFTTRVLERLEEYGHRTGGLPETLLHIKNRLPMLLAALGKAHDAIVPAGVREETKEAVQPAIDGCRQQIESLNDIVAKLALHKDSSWTAKGKKVWNSMRLDGKIESVVKAINCYVQAFTFFLVASATKSNPGNDKVLSNIHKWLSPPSPSENYHKALEQRLQGTGRWLIELERFQKWRTGEIHAIWLHGIPGAGKTLLSTAVIESIHTNLQLCTGQVAAFFYFDFNDTNKQLSDQMLKSLIFQLAFRCIKVPNVLNSAIESYGESKEQPPTKSLMAMLKALIQEFSRVFIVLDALDECKEVGSLMKTIQSLIGFNLDNLSVFLASRNEPEIREVLDDVVKPTNYIDAQSEFVDVDIQLYIDTRLSTDKRLKKWNGDPDLRRQIQDALMEKAHGMFRWAVCQLDSLRDCRNRAQLKIALNQLPDTLDETYDRILCSINNRDCQLAIRILRWLAFAARSLTLAEIATVVAINVENVPTFDSDEKLEDPLESLFICSSLVVTYQLGNPSKHYCNYGENWENHEILKRDDCTTFLALAHYSVLEYLVSDRIRLTPLAHYALTKTHSHAVLAQSCLAYLQHCFTELASEEDVSAAFSYWPGPLELRPLADYCGRWWSFHAHQAEPYSEDMKRSLIQFFSNRNGLYRWLQRFLYSASPQYTRDIHFWAAGQAGPPLLYLSACGLVSIVRLLLHEGKDCINEQFNRGLTPLIVAIWYRHSEVVEELVQAGADCRPVWNDFCDALTLAAERESPETVKLLVKSGAPVNIPWGPMTVLVAACNASDGKMVDFLLDAGADVNLTSRIRFRIWPTARLQTVFAGVNNLCIDKPCTPLSIACHHADLKNVKRLLQAGALVNIGGARQLTALQEICSIGDHPDAPEIVQLLLEHGANVTSQAGRGQTPLLNACSLKSSSNIVRLLLEWGADPNFQGEWDPMSCLEAASSLGVQIVEKRRLVSCLETRSRALLLEKGHPVSCWETSPSSGVSLTTLQLLLDAGADVYNDCVFSRALLIALGRSTMDAARLLLLSRRDLRQPNSSTTVLERTLAMAAQSANHHAIELLIGEGFNLDFKERNLLEETGNALHIALACWKALGDGDDWDSYLCISGDDGTGSDERRTINVLQEAGFEPCCSDCQVVMHMFQKVEKGIVRQKERIAFIEGDIKLRRQMATKKRVER